MKTLTTCTLVFALALIVSFSTDAAVIADPAADWVSSDGTTAGSVVGGTAAGWSYFRSDAANGGAEVALVQSGNTGDVGGPGFGSVNSVPGNRTLPAVLGDNANGSELGFEDYELFGDGQLNSPVVGTDLLIHAGFSNVLNAQPILDTPGSVNYVIVRYTVSAADIANHGTSATIAGSFRELIGGGTPTVLIYQNDAQLFTATGVGGALTQVDGTFNLNATIAENDTIDFIVDVSTGLGGTETALRATIDVVPEPSSLALIGLGGLALARRRRA